MTAQRVQPQWSYNDTDSDAVSDTVSDTVFLRQVSERQHILHPRERFS